jgi:hypothetical protein
MARTKMIARNKGKGGKSGKTSHKAKDNLIPGRRDGNGAGKVLQPPNRQARLYRWKPGSKF